MPVSYHLRCNFFIDNSNPMHINNAVLILIIFFKDYKQVYLLNKWMICVIVETRLHDCVNILWVSVEFTKLLLFYVTIHPFFALRCVQIYITDLITVNKGQFSIKHTPSSFKYTCME